ncbi:short-chain dehydrogenase/reductase 1 isoform X4 [Tasmannia lanceolata]|uniref:short-chain dehydrogenase/reductase 1 isoform X4 n=1 Tax=Tasmannia lanceolata TaxID=3420 RepID=UPI004064400B
MEEETNSNQTAKRCAVVTGANKGIGLEICRQLASNGIMVILTARDERRGIEAVENLKEFGLSDVIFHQLDVKDSVSISLLASFVKTHFGKLDILVNNAGDNGIIVDHEALKALKLPGGKVIPNVSVREELSDADSLREERLDEILQRFLNDFKEDSLEIHGWPTTISAYKVSKVALNAYTRILAKRYPTFCVNCVHPGLVKTDINPITGFLTPEEGARGPVMLALLPAGPSGLYFDQMEASNF